MKVFGLRNKNLKHLAFASLLAATATSAQAQNYVNAQPKGDHAVTFDVTAKGTKNSSDLKWGADIAWKEEVNLSRSAAFMGDALQVVRTSFQPTADVGSTVDKGTLSTDQVTALNTRIDWLNKYTDKNTVKLVLNCDHPSGECDNNYEPGWTMKWSTSTTVVKRWTELIRLSKEYYKNAGYNVVSIAPLNEPDYNHGYLSTTASYNQNLFRYLAQALKERYGDAIRICGPNVLDPKYAETWFGKITDSYIDEVNTHELGGHFNSSSGFDTWVKFYDDHKSANKVTNDEMHNTFEGMVGLEHGLTTGIWWGVAERVRGEFCKATHGDKLAYVEDRTKWTAATVYRAPSGQIQAFGGTSERNGQATGYRFVSTERDVFFDGQGPMREYTMSLPGGTAYQTGQTNAEGVVNITYGEDIQPYINGTYALYNKNTNKVLELKNRNTGIGTHITTGTYNIAKDYCQWKVYPVATTVGGGFSYHTISNCAAALYVDCWNSAMESGTEIGVYTANGAPQYWYFDYAGDGWFHIRSGISNLCLATKSDGTICQVTKDASDATQLWRLLPIEDTSFAVRKVTAPSNVTATAQNASVKIEWTNAGGTMKYSVFRSETSKPEEYDLIARNIKGGEFVDNKVVSGKTYYYVVKAVDATLNTSERSNEVSAAPTGTNGLVLDYGFERVLTDASENKNDAAALHAASYDTGRESRFDAMEFDGKNFLKLSTAVASHKAITVAAWVYWTGSATSERIFEFAKDADNYFCLTPNSAKICVNGSATTANMSSSLSKNAWHHIAVTLDGSSMKVYVDGSQNKSASCTKKSSDFMPFINAIGSGQASDAKNFNGRIDNFQVYNYAMSASEISALKGQAEDTSNKPEVEEDEVVDNTDYPVDYTDKVVNPNFDEDKTGWSTNEKFVTWGNNKIATNQGNDITGKFYELYGQDGVIGGIYQAITDIPNGVYELKAAVFRDQLFVGEDADAVYLYANDEQTVVNTATPTFMKVLVQVTDDDKHTLTVGIKSISNTYRWMGIDNVRLYYYGNTTPEEIPMLSLNKQFRELKASIKDILADETYALVIGKERSDLDALRDMTVTDKTADGYNAAINTINNGINVFKNALPQYQFFKQELDNADKLGLGVTTEHTLFNNPTTTAAILQSNFPALYEKVNAEIDRVYTANYTDKVTQLINWETNMGKLAGQHWDGTTNTETGTKYLDASIWSGTFFYANTNVTLPAGRYALRMIGRSANNNVDMRLLARGQNMRFPIKGDIGLGVTTSGEKSFNESKNYANEDAGRGWEYRNILFVLNEECEVNFEIDAKCTADWMGMSNVELWRANDIVSMTITDAKYSTLMLPFAAKIPEGLEAFSCTVEGEHLHMTSVTSIEANTPYVMRGETGTYKFEGLGEAEEDTYTSGCLTGVYTDRKAPIGSYVLQKQNNKVAFYVVGESKRPYVRANRAYVTVPDAGVKMLSFLFNDDDSTTDIEVVEGKQIDLNAVADVYTITGVKVSSGKSLAEVMNLLHKGSIYIVNGKMLIVR